MNKEMQEKAASLAPVYGDYDRTGSFLAVAWRWLKNVLRVGAYKLGFLMVVETLSKAGAACVGWPLFNGLVIWGMKAGGMDVKAAVATWPLQLVLVIQAIFLGMWAFKGTTKKLLDMAGQALLEWAKKR